MSNKNLIYNTRKDNVITISNNYEFSWEELGNLGKKQGGFETIEYNNFKSSITNNLPSSKNISKDTKLYVFRFGHGKYRMICYKSNSCYAAMHLIGFDFDYSLYHGS